MNKSIEQKYIEALETIILLKNHIDSLNVQVLNFMTNHPEVASEIKTNLQVLKFPDVDEET